MVYSSHNYKEIPLTEACSTRKMTEWRKKIKSWIFAYGKHKKSFYFSSHHFNILGGGLIVTNDLKDSFHQKITCLLEEKIKIRCFPLLRENLLEILSGFPNQKNINKNSCKKRWWRDFCKQNPDVKILWKKLPLERTYNMNNRKIPKQKIIEEKGDHCFIFLKI